MLNKLGAFLKAYHMVEPGDTVVCAVSGGPDSMALLWGMYLLREKLRITLQAAHFNHGLRGEESDQDEAFVRDFCKGYGIPFLRGSTPVVAGAKGLEAAAREARYGFLSTIPGKIATAHNADDNAETVIMHLLRGTGLKGLGGITPVRGNLIRPMLSITRQEILLFLEEYSIPYVEDSTNSSRDFLRNRIRHGVIPLLKEENPKLAENLSATALRLRQDEAALEQIAAEQYTSDVDAIRRMEPAVRNRVLSELLLSFGVKEPEAIHIAQLQKLVNSPNPSAKISFGGGITVQRVYGRIEKVEQGEKPADYSIAPMGVTKIPRWGVEVICTPVPDDQMGVCPVGPMVLRSRCPGDTITLSFGTKSLKKLFIDKKIPASQRDSIPVIADEQGVLAVERFGMNLSRGGNAAIKIEIRKLK